jgi:hypothetical protein
MEPSELKFKGIQYCGSCPLRRSGACCHLQEEKKGKLVHEKQTGDVS